MLPSALPANYHPPPNPTETRNSPADALTISHKQAVPTRKRHVTNSDVLTPVCRDTQPHDTSDYPLTGRLDERFY